jgi:Kef-type K+ transport system membrane component KefB
MLTVAALMGICGVCALPFIQISPLLCCMVFGASYVNFSKDEKLFAEVDGFTPPIMCLFFVLSGMKMDFSNFALVGLLGLVYFLARILGKYMGGYVGCVLAREPKNVTVNFGLALIPQAGVAIGLADLGSRLLPEGAGSIFLSIILCSSILYEMIGPAAAKYALIRSGSIPQENLEKKRGKRELIAEAPKNDHH